MIDAWRLVKAAYAATPLSGEGARRYGGRFNSEGTAVVYAAGSLALAELEVLVNLPAEGVLTAYVAFRLRFDEALVEPLGVDALPMGWRRSPVPHGVQALGDAWARAGQSPVLRVPSAIVPAEPNYLLNPAHPDLARVEVTGPIDPEFDPRLF